MEDTRALESVPDDELLRRLVALLRNSRHTEADLVAHVGEVDVRRLYAREASPSMFVYCTERLHLSEAEAYLRIAAARASREHPMILAMLADGRLHLTAIAKLAPHLTPENRDVLLERATHRTKREIEELVAEIAPRPELAATIRKLPERQSSDVRLSVLPPSAAPSFLPVSPAGPSSSAQSSATPNPVPQPGSGQVGLPVLELRPDRVRSDRLDGVIEPLAPARYKVQFTASAELRDKLERLQALMRSSVPDVDLATVIEAAVSEKLERLEARRFGRTKAPRKHLSGSNTSPRTRQVPAAVKRAVYERDEGRCRYVDGQGKRCTARGELEFHHRHPFALGGDHSPGNVALLCRLHNLLLAEIDYGRGTMARRRRSNVSSLQRSLQT
jgi:5-methylcytosine-specific restriction endonuclease McrA